MSTTIFVTLTHISCYSCGVVFGIEATRYSQLLESHENFWCPNGHTQRFVEQTEKEKRIAELEREARTAKASRDFWAEQSKSANQEVEHKTRQLAARKGVTTRLKRRLTNGQCPCCSRKFKDLKTHMATAHPKYDVEKEAAAREASTATK